MSQVQKEHLKKARIKSHAVQKKNGHYSVMGRVSAHLLKHKHSEEEIKEIYSKRGKLGGAKTHSKK